MELARINNLPVRTTFQIGPDADDALHLVYRVGALTPEFWAWYYAPNGATVYDALERVLLETGITVDGEPVPPTAEAIRAAGLTAQVARAIFEHIREEFRAGKLSAAS